MDTSAQRPTGPTSDSTRPNAGLDALLEKLQPLLDSGRLDNVVDLLSLLSDLVDLLDPPMVEKLARLFEEGTAATWHLGNALRQAKAETMTHAPPSLRDLLALLRNADTRRGVALVLRTLSVIGRQC
ncbi:DUF1641 domain-containing protein [Pseudomonas chlororaphis]|uniref:DUF1641 domain-containing protein n=1 Tax=Pseudomonas chlororaphis TaxID=587753 RepID=A0A1Q8EUN4_9PSED|nr:DUF1641 domain-containing protein [Pseudomonas chlororaphis]OLF55516.1 hypothetical protein BTN82_06110 [Pseudomonas chlororaphis]